MVSTFFGLNIAASGLRAANAALNTTGNNISNVNTDGYSRQLVNAAPSDALRTFTRYGSAGAGVDTLAIERVRDQFYDNRYRQNETILGEYEMKNYFNKNLELYFKDDGSTGFSSLFDKMQAALQTAMKNSGSATTKTAYVSTVEAMTEYFNTLYGSLQREQADANDELKIRVSQINSIAQELATINGRINLIEMTGTTANELRDKRDLMLDELSKIVDIETRETEVKDLTQPDRHTGATRFEVHIAGGQLLVDGSEYKQLLTVARKAEEKVNQNDIEGLYDIKWISSNYDPETSDYLGDFDLGNPHIGGELGGIIQMRDGNNGKDFHGYVHEIDRDNRLVTIRTDEFEDYLKNLDQCTIPSTGQITVDNVKYEYDTWTYREVTDNTGTHYEYTFHFITDVTDAHSFDTGLPVATDADHTTGYAQIGPDIEYQGIAYYMAQANEFARIFTCRVNSIMHDSYLSDEPVHGTSLLTGNRTMGVNPPQYTDKEMEYYQQLREYDAAELAAYQAAHGGENPEDLYGGSYKDMYAGLTTAEALELFQEEARIKGQSYLTAGNFAVSSGIKTNPSRMATRSDVTEGVDEMRALDALYKMCAGQSELGKDLFRGASAGEFLDKVLADVSLNASNSQTNEDTYLSLKTTITNQRNSISGVDEDEEAANLVKYQNSYTLASKMIQTLTEIYDRLITQTGV
ncbi:MAG: flagellar hook-associated protein FlgK [Lachnospiraceae bacterium]|nr:flagellar hook-associated protein FlgK [Lachnospiraceae bacterium]